MRALAWHGNQKVRVDTVPDPTIESPTDAVVRITSSAICGSDLHLYGFLGPFIDEGDRLGHEPMGIVEAVGSEVTHIAAGDRVVVPFNISCGHCWTCQHQLFAQCETTQVRDKGMGASQFDLDDNDDLPGAIRELTDGRGPDAVIDAVGMEAHGNPGASLIQKVVGLLPHALAAPMMEKAGLDRLAALKLSIETVRRGGTISVIGLYGGMADPLPMLQIFDKGIQLRMGQAHVKRWVDDIMPLLTGDGDPLDVEGLATHRLPLEEGP